MSMDFERRYNSPIPAFVTPVNIPSVRNVWGPTHVNKTCAQRAMWQMGTPLPKSTQASQKGREQKGRRATRHSSRRHEENHRVEIDLTSEERLQKVLSRLGVASRRNAETMITNGRVCVNGRQTRQLGTSVNVWKDRITVDGTAVQVSTQVLWIALHKPRGYVTKMTGHRGLQRFFGDSLMDRSALVAVDGIEEDASGLVLFTNERGAVPELARPDNPHIKIWTVDCRGEVSDQQLRILNKGVRLKDGISGHVVQADVDVIGSGKLDVSSKEKGFISRLEIRMRDSRHHAVRRMCEAVGLDMIRMSRRAFGPVLLGSLRQGEQRKLTWKEIKALKRGVSDRQGRKASSS